MVLMPPSNAPSTSHQQQLLTRSVEKMFEDAEMSGVLLLAGRKLKELPANLSSKYDISDVVSADLSDNRLCELPVSICELSAMETLQVRCTGLRSLPPAVQLLESLTYLDLSGNQLTSLPVGLFSIPLQVLLVTGNRLESIPREVRQLSDTLQELDASYNRLCSIPADIALLKSLRVLSLRANRLTHLPCEISRLELRVLDVSENELAELPSELRHMCSLVDLNVDVNPLTSPPAKICSKGREHAFKWLRACCNASEGASKQLDWSLSRPATINATLRRARHIGVETAIDSVQRRSERRSRSSRFNTLGGSDSGYASTADEHRYSHEFQTPSSAGCLFGIAESQRSPPAGQESPPCSRLCSECIVTTKTPIPAPSLPAASTCNGSLLSEVMTAYAEKMGLDVIAAQMTVGGGNNGNTKSRSIGAAGIGNNVGGISLNRNAVATLPTVPTTVVVVASASSSSASVSSSSSGLSSASSASTSSSSSYVSLSNVNRPQAIVSPMTSQASSTPATTTTTAACEIRATVDRIPLSRSQTPAAQPQIPVCAAASSKQTIRETCVDDLPDMDADDVDDDMGIAKKASSHIAKPEGPCLNGGLIEGAKREKFECVQKSASIEKAMDLSNNNTSKTTTQARQASVDAHDRTAKGTDGAASCCIAVGASSIKTRDTALASGGKTSGASGGRVEMQKKIPQGGTEGRIESQRILENSASKNKMAELKKDDTGIFPRTASSMSVCAAVNGTKTDVQRSGSVSSLNSTIGIVGGVVSPSKMIQGSAAAMRLVKSPSGGTISLSSTEIESIYTGGATTTSRQLQVSPMCTAGGAPSSTAVDDAPQHPTVLSTISETTTVSTIATLNGHSEGSIDAERPQKLVMSSANVVAPSRTESSSTIRSISPLESVSSSVKASLGGTSRSTLTAATHGSANSIRSNISSSSSRGSLAGRRPPPAASHAPIRVTPSPIPVTSAKTNGSKLSRTRDSIGLARNHMNGVSSASSRKATAGVLHPTTRMSTSSDASANSPPTGAAHVSSSATTSVNGHHPAENIVETMRKAIENRLNVSVPAEKEQLASSLADGVLLCNFANRIRVRAVPTVLTPLSPQGPMSIPRCRRNVENFLAACRRIGVPEGSLCNCTDILERRALQATAKTVLALNKFASGPSSTSNSTKNSPPIASANSAHSSTLITDHRRITNV